MCDPKELYDSCLQVAGWSKEETDHLMDLAGRFDLRWIIIHDRWDKKFAKRRSVEDLKERYYNIANAITRAQAATDVQPDLVYFDAEHERRRKEQMEKLWRRTDEQIEEEEELLQELKRIEARRKERDKKALDLQKLITAADRSPIIAGAGSMSNLQTKKAPKQILGRPPSVALSLTASSSSADQLGAGLKFPEFRGAGPHMRSQEMKINQQVGQKKAKVVDQVLEKLKLEHNPIATEAIVKHFNEIRSDVILLYELKGALTSCEYELEALRHQYRAITGKDLEIPSHIRVTQEFDDGGSPTKRRLTASMDLTAGNQPPRKKKLPEGNPALRKLRRS